MQREPHTYLRHVLSATRAIETFVEGKAFEEYSADLLLKSAVERQLEITGEALSQLSKIAPDLAARVPDLGRIIAFRDLLDHRHSVIDDQAVWRVVRENVPSLARAVTALLDRERGPGQP